MPLEGLPEGTRQNGHEDYVVQDLVFDAHNLCYQRLRYVLPDGTSRTAPLPAEVQGHFGPTLKGYVLYQYHQNHVTQPLIHEDAYRKSPTPKQKAKLQEEFNELFTRRTGFPELNGLLKGIHHKLTELLLVLDRPELPLHNNSSESNIRE